MKTIRFHSVFSSAILSSAIAIGLLASTEIATAQNSPRVSVTIPFSFRVGSTQMPAGVYDMRQISDNHLLELRGQGSGKIPTAVLMVYPSEGQVKKYGRLVFHVYGNQCFLREVWEANSVHGVKSSPSRDENEILHSRNQVVTQTQLAFNAGPN